MSERLSETEAEAMSQQVGSKMSNLGRGADKKTDFTGELREPDRGARAGDQRSEDKKAGGGDGVQHVEADGAEQGGGGKEAAFHHGGEFVASITADWQVRDMSDPSRISLSYVSFLGYPSRLPHHLFLLRSGSKSWRWRETN